jgi:hypothetical protein
VYVAVPLLRGRSPRAARRGCDTVAPMTPSLRALALTALWLSAAACSSSQSGGDASPDAVGQDVAPQDVASQDVAPQDVVSGNDAASDAPADDAADDAAAPMCGTAWMPTTCNDCNNNGGGQCDQSCDNCHDGHAYIAVCDPAAGTCSCRIDGTEACQCHLGGQDAGSCRNCCWTLQRL